MPSPAKKSHLTHQQRLARGLHHATGCGYQEALRRFSLAARAGQLPPVLDGAGRQRALQCLSTFVLFAIA
jgi:hypothetical protein